MSLSDRLKDAAVTTERRCKLINIIGSQDISEKDRETFVALMSVPVGTPGRLLNVVLASALRAEGYDISDSAVDRHRRGSCSCTRPTGKQ
jgi:hypothetical protein